MLSGFFLFLLFIVRNKRFRFNITKDLQDLSNKFSFATSESDRHYGYLFSLVLFFIFGTFLYITILTPCYQHDYTGTKAMDILLYTCST